MPIPSHIIGAMHHSEDRTTGLISYFQIVEKLTIHATDASTPELKKLAKESSARVFFLASWMQESEHIESELYEGRWRIQVPGNIEPELLHEFEFQFNELFVKLAVNLGLGLAAAGAGPAFVENQIRVKGSSEPWQSQRFNFWLESAPLSLSEEPPP